MKVLLEKRRIGVGLIVGLVILVCLASLQIWSSLRPANASGVSQNKGISSDEHANQANYDGARNSYSAQALLKAAQFQPGTPFTFNGVNYTWYKVDEKSDNEQANGQILTVTSGAGAQMLSLIGSATNGSSSGQATLTYTDGSKEKVSLGFSDWTLGAGREQVSFGNQVVAKMPYRNVAQGSKNREVVATYLFETELALKAGKTLRSMTLPSAHSRGELHIFASGTRGGSTPIPGHTPTPVPTQMATPTPVPTQTPPTTGGTRDAALWPYDAHSPWNAPIGSSAQFAAPTSPNWPNANKYGFIMTSDLQWSVPVYIAKDSDPVRTIYRTDGSPPGYAAFQIHAPANIAVGKGGDDELAIVDEKHQSVVEMINAEVLPNGDIRAPFPNKIDLRGPGISNQYIGMCAYGGSCSAGLIRKGEIANGIHHALRMSLITDVLNWSAPGGKHHVWPASSEDGGGNYTGVGNIYMGSLLAIPPSVDVSKIAAPGTALYALAKALQDYGVYITDRGQENIYVEPSAASEVASLQYNNVLAPYLKVVTNNGPSSVGGGGTPIVPLAPPIK